MTETIRFIIVTTISGLACAFSLLSYRRHKRFDNENYLFKMKMEGYIAINASMSNMLHLTQECIALYTAMTNGQNVGAKIDAELDQLGDKVNELVSDFNQTIAKHSLVISDVVFIELDRLMTKLYRSDVPRAIMHKTEDKATVLNQLIDELLDAADKINSVMRDDLNVDALNYSLYKRLK